MVKCSHVNKGCNWEGELQSLDDHCANDCEYTMVPCPNKCTQHEVRVSVVRRDLENHRKECPNRKCKCLYCGERGRYWEMKNHLNVCSQAKVTCTNQCRETVKRCDMEQHRSVCPNEKVRCKYADIGCEHRELRNDIGRHERDDTLHLHLALGTVTKLRRQLDEVRSTQALPVFKISHFDHYKMTRNLWYSPPFYSHPGGYRMCIRMDVNGENETEGEYISVFVFMMAGENDDHLIWPFRGEVTIELLNQLEDKNHYTRTLPYKEEQNEDDNRRVWVGERAMHGRGKSRYISHAALACNEMDYQYLKDDCIYFRVCVEVYACNKPWLTCTV